MANKISMNSQAGNLLAIFAMSFRKVDKKYIYKAFLKSDGKHGKHGTTVQELLRSINSLPPLDPPHKV
jgi:hypothetical protein